MAYGLRPGDPRDILVAKFEIENEEVFHFKNLYKLIYEWLEEEGYKTIDEAGEIESLYLEMLDQEGNKQHHIWWRTQMIPEDNRYYRYFLKIDFQTLNMKSIEIMEQGHKMSTNKGDVIFRVEGWLQLDYRNEWQNHWFLKHWDKLYRERIYKNQIETYRADFYSTVYRLQQTVKQYLKLKTPFPRARLFRPEKGLG